MPTKTKQKMPGKKRLHQKKTVSSTSKPKHKAKSHRGVTKEMLHKKMSQLSNHIDKLMDKCTTVSVGSAQASAKKQKAQANKKKKEAYMASVKAKGFQGHKVFNNAVDNLAKIVNPTNAPDPLMKAKPKAVAGPKKIKKKIKPILVSPP